MRAVPPTENRISSSAGLAGWLLESDLSLCFSSYDSNLVYFLGQRNDSLSVVYRQFERPMGLTYHDDTLYVASAGKIVELESSEGRNDLFDTLFVPRRSTNIGACDAHELAVSKDGLLFANTAYSCVATMDKRRSFKHIWKPEFISKLVPEDRCHLNGLCVNDGELAYVSVCNKSDMLEGWRANRGNGGMIIDVQSGELSVVSLSMPHSPRWHNGQLWWLDSGRGHIVNDTNSFFCPGFLRGLAFHNRYAIVTVSKPRQDLFHGLELQDEINKRGGEAWCGVLIVDTETGSIEQWLRIEGPTRELFDVVTMPYIKCPNAIAPADPSLLNRVTFTI